MRLLLTAGALLLLVLAGTLGVLYLGQRQLIYFPQLTQVDAGQTNLSLQSGDVTLRGWVVNPGQQRAILYFGGNAERVEASRGDFARWFPGGTVYLLAYRGYGASEGVPSERALVEDATALYDHVRQRHPDRSIDVIGRSLGSGVASALAGKRQVRRLVLVTPFDSLAAVASTHYPWVPVDWLLRDRYESAQHLAGYRGPVLVVRAGLDEVVPPASTTRLTAAIRPAPSVLVLQDAGHNDLSDKPGYGRVISEFLR